jgi:hypothetical protein
VKQVDLMREPLKKLITLITVLCSILVSGCTQWKAYEGSKRSMAEIAVVRQSAALQSLIIMRVDGKEISLGIAKEIHILPGDHIFGFSANPMLLDLIPSNPNEKKPDSFRKLLLYYVKFTAKAGASYHIDKTRGESETSDNGFPIYIDIIEDKSGNVVSTTLGIFWNEPNL